MGKSYRYVFGRIQKADIQRKASKVDFHEAKVWLEHHIQHKYKPYQHNGTPELRESQARKEAAIARIKELEAEEREGGVINKEQAYKTFFTLGRQARDAMLAIPARISGVLAVETDQRIIGCKQKNPAITIARESLQLVRNFCTEFGLTPSSRTRVSVAEVPQTDRKKLFEF